MILLILFIRQSRPSTAAAAAAAACTLTSSSASSLASVSSHLHRQRLLLGASALHGGRSAALCLLPRLSCAHADALIGRACGVASGSMTDSFSFSSREVLLHTLRRRGSYQRWRTRPQTVADGEARGGSSFILIRLSARRDGVKLIQITTPPLARRLTRQLHTDRSLLRTMSFENVEFRNR